MVITSALVGMTVPDVGHSVDERWTMAYAASLDDHRPEYFDTERPGGVVAHPVFAVCPEWPAIVASRDLSINAGVTPAEVLTSVHATHDTTIHRLVRPGDELVTSLEMVGVEQISPGAKSTTRLTTVDAAGLPVATTTQCGIYLGQPLNGDGISDPNPPSPLAVDRVGEPTEVTVAVPAGAAHTYTECARIWNPIHTDSSVAKASGLPDIILHGTANLAHGVTAVIDQAAGGDPERVRRIVGRFAAMVRMPSELTVRVWPGVATEGEGEVVPFEVLNAEGQPAVKDGFVVLTRRATT